MERFELNDKAIFYKVLDSDSFDIKIIDQIIYVYTPNKYSKEDIEDILLQHFNDLYTKQNKDKKIQIVHFNNKPYKVIIRLGKKDKLILKDDEMIIISSILNTMHYKSILWNFYKKEVEKELIKLMYDAQNEFKEIVFPSIKVKKLPYGLYGNYNKVKNHINISSLMARRDLKYIKVVLYHELSHYFIMNHSEDFIRIFKSKFKEGPSLDVEFKEIKYRDCL